MMDISGLLSSRCTVGKDANVRGIIRGGYVSIDVAGGASYTGGILLVVEHDTTGKLVTYPLDEVTLVSSLPRRKEDHD